MLFLSALIDEPAGRICRPDPFWNSTSEMPRRALFSWPLYLQPNGTGWHLVWVSILNAPNTDRVEERSLAFSILDTRERAPRSSSLPLGGAKHCFPKHLLKSSIHPDKLFRVRAAATLTYLLLRVKTKPNSFNLKLLFYILLCFIRNLWKLRHTIWARETLHLSLIHSHISK